MSVHDLRHWMIALGLMAGLVLASPAAAQWTNKIDINRADRTALASLPIPGELVEAIVEYRTYVAYFTSIYDLLRVPGMTPELLVAVRPHVILTPEFEMRKEELREEEERARERYYVMQRMLSNEGVSEGLVDSYIDQIREPTNVNDLSFYDLIGYQNISPVDALAILREINQSGGIENDRQLRSSSGLSYYGYRNLRDFVTYEHRSDTKRLSGDFQFRLYDTPYGPDQDEILLENISGGVRNFDTNTYQGRMNIGTTDPYMTNKLRLRFGRYWSAGLITHRNMGETEWAETGKGFLEIKDLPPTRTALGKLRLNSAVVGNLAVTFGQGLVMDASDFFSARRTGFGWAPRQVGLRGDLSRSDEYTLRGAGVDATLGRVRGTFFYSNDDKDAILNPDGSFNSYIRMIPRVSNEEMASITQDIEDGVLENVVGTEPFYPMRDVMGEKVAGANLKFEFTPGTYIGVTGVEMRYKNNEFDTPLADRWNPDPLTLVIDPGRLGVRDGEIGSRYNSVNLGNYRRVWGAEAQTVFKNVSLAAEYGKLETSDAGSSVSRIFDSGPEAFVATAYVQYENFHVLGLYRDYDIGYDNPYNRAFSEDSKFEQTILDGNAFRLKNPYWASLGAIGGTPSPKAERGVYFDTRYQFSRQALITGLEFDSWVRKVDNTDQQRITLRGEYRPVFPVRLRLRHRVSSRDENYPEDIRRFESWDTRLELRLNLSRFDTIDLLYSSTNVKFSARGRLNGQATGGDTQADSTAWAGLPGRALMGRLTHNFGQFFTVTFASEIYDGFLWNYEDNEFVVVDGEGFRNWVMLLHRLSENLSWRLKWTTDHKRPRTYVDIRNFGNLVPPTPDAVNARNDRSSFRFQLDYTF